MYKMPHLRGWSMAQERLTCLPSVEFHEVLVVDSTSRKEVGRIPAHGRAGDSVMARRPDGRQARSKNSAFPGLLADPGDRYPERQDREDPVAGYMVLQYESQAP